jgi:NADH:ubiquinone oxidoreductase subunit H
MLAYEFIFIAMLAIVLIKAGGSLIMLDIINIQFSSGLFINSYSGFIAAVLAIFYFQAKLGIAPFDAAEAEQEIMAGTMIEYGGPLLGFYKLAKMLIYFSLPLFIIGLLAPTKNYLFFTLQYFLLIFIASVIKNINPRLRIADILRFFWFRLFPLGILGIILALKGL